MASKEQFLKIARLCSEHRMVDDEGLRSEAMRLGDYTKSCENCVHFTANHKCDINLIDEILTNMPVVDYDQEGTV